MRPKGSVLILGYLVVEALLLVWFGAAFGTGPLIGLLLAGFLLGLLVMRISGLQAFRALTDAQRRAAAFGVTTADGSQVLVPPEPVQKQVQRTTRDLGESSLLFVAGMLLAVPGIISDAVGLVLLLPSVRRRLAGRMAATFTSRPGPTTITVIQADQASQQWHPRPGDQDQPPRVIRGDLLPRANED